MSNQSGYKQQNENFDEAVAAHFYAAKINAFQYAVVGPDGYVTNYTCAGAIIFTIVSGVVVLALITLTVSSFVLSKKGNKEK